MTPLSPTGPVLHNAQRDEGPGSVRGAPAAADSVTGSWLRVGPHRVHCIDQGPAAAAGAGRLPLVFLHGNPTSSFLYRDVIRRLCPQRRCIAPDLPGFGRSSTPPRPLAPEAQAKVVAGLLDALRLDAYVLVAHDWGGPIGLAAARQRPQALRGLVLANTFAWPVPGVTGWRLRLFSLLAGSPVAALANRCCNAFLTLGLRIAIRRRPLPAAVLEGYRAPLRQRKRRAAVHHMARALLGSRAFLAAVERDLVLFRHRPLLLCWGERDPFIGAGERRRFAAAFAQHETLRLPRAGHFVPEDAPDTMADAVSAWLEEGSPC